MLSDIKHAVRGLKQGAGPLLVGVLSLALGIAATATMVGVIDAIDFRPLPFRDPDALVDVSLADPARGGHADRVSPGVYLDWQARARSVARLGAASAIGASLQDGGPGLDAARVSEDFFATIGVQPFLGRVFTAEEIRQRARLVVLAYDVWQSRFGADTHAIGRTVPLSWAGEYRSEPAEPHTIVGVLPRGVRYPAGAQMWIPAGDGFGASRRDPYLTVVGRLAPGASMAAARTELAHISAQLATEFPESDGRQAARVSALRDAMRTSVDDRGAAARRPLLGVAAFVLVLAMFNVAGLFLARTAGQMRELRTRLALGAPRARLATLLVTQSVTVSLAAGLVGLAIARSSLHLVASRLQVAESGAELMLDGRFAIGTLFLSLLTGLLVAWLPLRRLTRLEAHDVLGAISARGTSVAPAGRVQRGLVVGQIALAVVLLSGAAALSAEFLRLVTSAPGFVPERLIVASLPIGTGDAADALTQAQRVEQQLHTVGGITSAALGGQPAEGYTYRLESGDTTGSSPTSYRVSPGYFATLGIALDAGREFAASDREGAVPVAIVNRLTARLWWPNQDSIGKTVYMTRRDRGGEWVRIVGLVDNERVRRSLTSELRPVLYRPFAQLTDERRQVHLFARVEHRAGASFGAVRGAIESVYGAGGWRGERVATMESLLGASLAEQRFRASAFSLFSTIALLLAAMGIYGIVATMVAQRRPEFGLRIALGARPRQVLALVFRQGAGLAAAGFILGIAGAAGMSRVLQSLLVRAGDFDLWTPLAAGMLLAGAVAIACYFPARRAARIDPARLLNDA